jgi:hypothetical protein
MTAPAPALDDPVGAWERRLQAREQWREDMQPSLEAHAAELPHPRTSPSTVRARDSARPAAVPAGRTRRKILDLVSAQAPPGIRLTYTSVGGAALRVTAHLPGAIVRNLDISPAATRKTYDALVHAVSILRPRTVRTIKRTGVPAGRLGALLVEDL